jgi:hypothetical protein
MVSNAKFIQGLPKFVTYLQGQKVNREIRTKTKICLTRMLWY